MSPNICQWLWSRWVPWLEWGTGGQRVPGPHLLHPNLQQSRRASSGDSGPPGTPGASWDSPGAAARRRSTGPTGRVGTISFLCWFYIGWFLSGNWPFCSIQTRPRWTELKRLSRYSARPGTQSWKLTSSREKNVMFDSIKFHIGSQVETLKNIVMSKKNYSGNGWWL